MWRFPSIRWDEFSAHLPKYSTLEFCCYLYGTIDTCVDFTLGFVADELLLRDLRRSATDNNNFFESIRDSIRVLSIDDVQFLFIDGRWNSNVARRGRVLVRRVGVHAV